MSSIPDDGLVIHADDPQALTHLLALPELQVTSLERADWLGGVYLQCTVVSPGADCPACGAWSTDLHEYKPRRVRDLPCWDAACYLDIAARRFHCAPCRRPFTEQFAALAPRARTTRRYAAHLVAQCRAQSVAQVARSEQHGYKAVEGIYFRHAAAAHPAAPPRTPIRCLGLDEFAAHKGQGDYKLVLVDHDTGRVFEQLADRKKETLRSYLLSWPADLRAAVEEVTADFWAAYHEVVAEVLPQARMTGDRFHVQQRVNEALTETRRSIQRRCAGPKGALRRQQRRLLGCNASDLDATERAELRALLAEEPTLGVAHDLKERLRRMYEEAANRANAAKRLGWWVKAARASGLAGFTEVANFMERWWVPILNYFVARRTNGRVEGFNAKIKLIKRRAFGFRNDDHFRLRVLMECDGAT